MKKPRLVDAAQSAGAATNGLVVNTAGRQRMLLDTAYTAFLAPYTWNYWDISFQYCGMAAGAAQNNACVCTYTKLTV